MDILAVKTPVPRGRNGKSAEIMAKFRAEIAGGERLPGHRMPSFSELGRLHGVAPLTAERIYAQLEREGLLVRQNGVGVFVCEQKRPRTGIIGFTGGRPFEPSGKRSPYFSALIEGIQDAAINAGVELLLLRPDSEIRWEKMDGVLLSQGFSQAVWDRFPPDMPFISLVMNWDGHASVISEDYPGMRDLTRHLIALGHEKIALFSTGENAYSASRFQAYSDGLRAAGIDRDPRWRRQLRDDERLGDFEQLGYLRMTEWLAEDWADLGCTALMAYNDDVAYGAIRALTGAGYSVPDQISVTGFDGTAPAPGQPHLTTAAVPLREIGRTGLEALIRWIERDEVAQTQRLDATFVAGQTTGHLQSSH